MYGYKEVRQSLVQSRKVFCIWALALYHTWRAWLLLVDSQWRSGVGLELKSHSSAEMKRVNQRALRLFNISQAALNV